MSTSASKALRGEARPPRPSALKCVPVINLLQLSPRAAAEATRGTGEGLWSIPEVAAFKSERWDSAVELRLPAGLRLLADHDPLL